MSVLDWFKPRPQKGVRLSFVRIGDALRVRVWNDGERLNVTRIAADVHGGITSQFEVDYLDDSGTSWTLKTYG